MNSMKSVATAIAMAAVLGLFASQTVAAQQKGTANQNKGARFVDQNGDGVCDNIGTRQGQRMGNGSKGKGYGPGNGQGNMGSGPKNGTGYGAKSGSGTGTGVCDGTGPKGAASRQGRK